MARPLGGTLVPVPWTSVPAGQVLMTLEDGEGHPSALEPRNVAARVLERFTAELGLRPCVAFELEFYLLDPEPDEAGRPRPPMLPGTERRATSTSLGAGVRLPSDAQEY